MSDKYNLSDEYNLPDEYNMPEPNRNPNLNTGENNQKSFPATTQTQNIRTRPAICYYSSFCQYSNELVDEIKRFNISDKSIQLICIDKNRKNLPPQITRVPTIFENNKIYVDEEAFTFITNIVKQSTINVMAVNTGVAASFSETFVSLEGNDGFSESACLDSANFSSIDDNSHIHMINEKKDSNNNTQSSDFAQRLEELQKSRANDIKPLKM